MSFFFVRCSNETPAVINQSESIDVLKSNFHFDSIQVVDISGHTVLIQIKNDAIFQSVVENIDNLDLENTTVLNWKTRGITAFVIKYKQNKKYYTYVLKTLQARSSGNNKSSFLMDFDNISSAGDGRVNYIDINENVISEFKRGIPSDTISLRAKNQYRACLDQAYDDICDGFIGCLAWYATPLVPVTAVVYCAF